MTHASMLFVSLALVAQTAAPPAQAPAIKMDGYPAPGEPAIVMLLAPGTAPLQALRYAIPKGQKARMDMTMAMSMAMDMGGMAVPVDMPPIKMAIDIAVTDVAANGDLTADLNFASMTVENTPGANPQLVQTMQAAFAGMTSLKARSIVSNRGVTRSTSLEVNDPAMRQIFDQVRSSFENLSMPFPVEAVGRGARWEVRQTMGGAQTVFQKSELEVVSIEGSAVSLKVRTEQVAPPQPVSNPDLPPGAEMRLEKLSGTGSGTMTIRLDSLVPTSQADAVSKATMSVAMGGQTQPVSVETKLKISITPGKER